MFTLTTFLVKHLPKVQEGAFPHSMVIMKEVIIAMWK
jgi:hypothetical protein